MTSKAMQWMAYHARVAAMEAAKKPKPKHNPKPPGRWIDGSTTQRVYEFLRSNPGRSFRHADLLRLLGCTSSALLWATSLLAINGYIERRIDSLAGRDRYRYSFKEESNASNNGSASSGT